jgi:hypothetical protein
MFNKLARIDAGRAQLAPAPVLTHHNDNHPCPRPALPPFAGPQRLASHWRPATTDGRLECNWQVEPADETQAPGPSFILRTTASAALRALGNATTTQTDGRAP